MYVQTHISDLLCPLIWQVSDNSGHAPPCTRKCPRCFFVVVVLMSYQFMFSFPPFVLIIIWQLNGFCFNDTHEPLCRLRAFILDQGAMKFILNINLLLVLLRWSRVILYYHNGKYGNGRLLISDWLWWSYWLYRLLWLFWVVSYKRNDSL